MKKLQKVLAVIGVIALAVLAIRGISSLAAGSQARIDNEVRSACGIGVALRGGQPPAGEPAVTLHDDSIKTLPTYRVDGGTLDGRRVHCLVTWEADGKQARAAMVRWDSTGWSVDL